MAANPFRTGNSTLDSRIPYDSEESFQIPATFQFGDNLLADYGGDSFFDRIDTTFSTPVPTRNVVGDKDNEFILSDTPPQPRNSTTATFAVSTRGEHPPRPTAALEKESITDGVDAKLVNNGPQANDMFERKKRDSYLQKGIDLSQHSTSRFRRKDNKNPNALTHSDHPIPVLRSKHLEAPTTVYFAESKHRGNSDEADTCEVTNWRRFDKILSMSPNNISTIDGITQSTSSEDSPPDGVTETRTVGVASGESSVRRRLTSSNVSSPHPEELTLSQLSRPQEETGSKTLVSPMKKSRKRVSSQVPDENIQYGPKRTKSAVRTGVSRSDVPAKHHQPPIASRKANKEVNGVHTRALQSSNTINAGTANTISRVLGAGPRRRKESTATLQQSGGTANAVASTSRLSNTVRSTYAVESDQDAGEMRGSQNLPRRQPQTSRTSLAEDKHRLRTLERSEGSRRREEWDVELTQVKEVPDSDKPDELLHRQPVKSTVPQEFRFQSDLRVAARRREFDDKLKVWQKRENHNSLNVPDFKALHAAYEASLAAKRKQVIPVIPAPLELSTAARVKERARFDEARRIREEEIKRQMDEMRKVREADEEREVRELRKRAIPRANPVPDWYADAPKTISKSASTRT